jgi:hypothetical protein
LRSFPISFIGFEAVSSAPMLTQRKSHGRSKRRSSLGTSSSEKQIISVASRSHRLSTMHNSGIDPSKKGLLE